MPVPSFQTKYILSETKSNLSGTKIFCLGQNILSLAKKFNSAIHKSLKMTSFVQKLTVSSGRAFFLDLYVAEINFLAMDKMFCLRQKSNVPDKFDLSRTKYILSGQMAWALELLFENYPSTFLFQHST